MPQGSWEHRVSGQNSHRQPLDAYDLRSGFIVATPDAYSSPGSFLWASRFTASGVGRPRCSSRTTRNCAARMPRRKCRAISLRDAGSLRSAPSGVLSASKGDGRRGGVSWDRRTTAAGVWRPWRSSNTTRSWAARIPRRIRRMVSSLDSLPSPLTAVTDSPSLFAAIIISERAEPAKALRRGGRCTRFWKSFRTEALAPDRGSSARGFAGSEPQSHLAIGSSRGLYENSYNPLELPIASYNLPGAGSERRSWSRQLPLT
jgi:hypothetical protein